jgi:hypothetical protein
MERFDRRAHAWHTRRAHAGRHFFERMEEKRSIGRSVCVSLHYDDLYKALFVFVVLLV